MGFLSLTLSSISPLSLSLSSDGLPSRPLLSALVALPEPGFVVPCGHQISKTFVNIKITILCGFVTILILLEIIGIGNLSSLDADVVNQVLIEVTNQIEKQ